ncbi:MAG: NADH-quinone oxidoreductase subunit J [Prevotella sp.]|nr:NADH-quinone oxidoreductase subunit J [Prevotella sp.]MBQ6210782.1 NADH-quinone oxidoreductase subunit J [Prevotella sp.]
MANLVMFCILAVLIIGSAILCVTTKSIMRAATFLLFVLFGVAGIYFLLDYTFLGAAQISIYAGGITMMYIFAIQLVSKRTLQGLQEHVKGSRVLTGALAALIGFGTVMIVFFKNQLFDRMAMMSVDNEVPMDKIGAAMVGADKYQYVLPFEFISIFLLACIIGGIMIARKEDKQ